MKDHPHKVANRFAIGCLIAGFVISHILNEAAFPSIWGRLVIDLIMAIVTLQTIGGLAIFLEKEVVGDYGTAIYAIIVCSVGIIITLIIISLPSVYSLPRPCHPNCEYCNESIEDWKLDAKEDYYEIGRP